MKALSAHDDTLKTLTSIRNILRVESALLLFVGLAVVIFAGPRIIGAALMIVAVDLLILAGSRARYLLAACAWLSPRARKARRVQALLDQTPPIEQIEVVRVINADAGRLWTVITDHELYGRLAPNLGRVEVLAPNGPQLQRRCYDARGRGWSEECTLWDEGSQFSVEVDTSDYPYPLSVMRGTWWVEPLTATRSRVGMRFQFRPRRGVLGRAFVIVMQAGFRPVVRRILRGWEHAAGAIVPSKAPL